MAEFDNLPNLLENYFWVGNEQNRPVAASLSNIEILGVGGSRLPVGSTAQRPVNAVIGMFRFNTTNNTPEYWTGANWISIQNTGTGTLYSITALDGLTGGTITTSGTVALGGITLSGDVTGTATIGNSSTVIATTLPSNPILGSSGSVTLPSGITGQRPSSPTIGMLRFNSSDNRIEFYNGSNWVFGPTGSLRALTAGMGLTGGTITTTGTLALGNITITGIITGNSTIGGSSTTIATSFAPNLVFPGVLGFRLPGNTSSPDNPVAGMIRYNSTLNKTEFYNGSVWTTGAAGTVTSVTAGNGLTGGTITTSGTINVGAITVSGVATGTATIGNNNIRINASLVPNFRDAGTVRLPSGTTAQRPNPPVAGMIRHNTTLNRVEFYPTRPDKLRFDGWRLIPETDI